MSDYRTKNRLILLGIEGTPGSEETLTPATNAIMVENPQPSPNFEVLQTNEAGGSLDGRGPIVGGGNFGMTFDAFLKGAGTPGEAPEYGPALRGCAMAETLTASDVTGTAQTGAAGEITLDAGDGASADDAYRGMVISITGGTGSGQVRVISGFTNSSKIATVYPEFDTVPDATSEYTIHANALYRPASENLENVTINGYDIHASGGQALLRKIVGAAGTFSMDITTRQIGRLSFNFTGILPSNPENVANPDQPVFDQTRPRPFIGAQAFLGGKPVKFRSFSLDIGAEVQQSDDPGATYGYDRAGVTSRTVTGQINPQLTLLSNRNVFADFTAGTARGLWLSWGSQPGNRVSVYLPEIVYTGADPADTDGYNAEQVPFESTGFDQGAFICVY